MSKTKVKLTYPCGTVKEVSSVIAAYGLRCNGERPVKIEISGKFTMSEYRQLKRTVSPNDGIVLIG